LSRFFSLVTFTSMSCSREFSADHRIPRTLHRGPMKFASFLQPHSRISRENAGAVLYECSGRAHSMSAAVFIHLRKLNDSRGVPSSTARGLISNFWRSPINPR